MLAAPRLAFSPPEPDVARCRIPHPIPSPSRLGEFGYQAWEWQAMWCPYELARVPAEQVDAHFAELDAAAGEVHDELLSRLGGRPARGMEELQRTRAATVRADAVVRAEWVQIPKEVDQPVWEPGWAQDVEEAVEACLDHYADAVLSCLSHLPPPLGRPWLTLWGLDAAGLSHELAGLDPLHRHLVLCEAKHRAKTQPEWRDQRRLGPILDYPAPPY